MQKTGPVVLDAIYRNSIDFFLLLLLLENVCFFIGLRSYRDSLQMFYRAGNYIIYDTVSADGQRENTELL